jgi:hypothetical protein
MPRPSRRRDSAFAGNRHVVSHYTRKKDEDEDEDENEDEDGDEDEHSTAATLVASGIYSIASQIY